MAVNIFNFIIIFIILITLAILYQKYVEKQYRLYIENDEYAEIKKYLLKDETLDKSTKPILWIHVPYEYNSRNWTSFGSRSSFELNQPYLYLTVKSIIKHCDDSFKIVIIDDGTFDKLIPGWCINMETLAEPIKSYVRQLGLSKLVYNYGGMNVPISFLCFKDLIGLYRNGTKNDKMFVCENIDQNVTQNKQLFYPNCLFFGAPKENQTIIHFIEYIQRKISSDQSSQAQFLGDFDTWCSKKIAKKHINLISGGYVGTKTVDDEPITVETLLGDDYINLYDNAYGIWIPDKMILKRVHYEWFARLSEKQVLQSRFILAKYFVHALAPSSPDGNIEPMKERQPDWIGFWRVPINADSHTLNVWGPKPIYLGNDIRRAKNAGDIV